jgi:hypothetical protein
MNFEQQKLTRKEWDFSEVSVSNDEKIILNMIRQGNNDVNYITNTSISIISFIKMDKNDNIHRYLFDEYFKESISKINKKYKINYKFNKNKGTKLLNSADKIRLEHFNTKIKDSKKDIFEFIVLEIIEKMLKNKISIKENDNSKYVKNYYYYYYTLYILNTYNVLHINTYFKNYVENILEHLYDTIDIKLMYLWAGKILEKNDYISKHKDIMLYKHQKELFTVCKRKQSKLILYIAPTGTGKTLSPIGLSETHKIIFICAARHVGLSLAKSAISVGKKIAFAFGCKDVSDIRLHRFAASKYVYNEKTGNHIKYKDGSKKIDNSAGEKVEIMICDVNSYICAMYYMNAFNEKENMIMYWDEPTIAMDYEQHHIHEKITENWQKNIIPNIILSSATLPNESEIDETISDFKSRFEDSFVHSIVSYECNKSIPIINKDNHVVMPHHKYEKYTDIKKCIEHCKNNKTIMRYFDLHECVKFVNHVSKETILKPQVTINNVFNTLDKINMEHIKLHYIDVLSSINEDKWTNIYKTYSKSKPYYMSTILFSTNDAHTITDGPSIFLSNDVNKIGKFILQNSKIPKETINNMMKCMEENDKIMTLINSKEKDFEDSLGKDSEKDNKMVKNILNDEQRRLQKEIETLYRTIETIELNNIYIPNTMEHVKIWNDKEKTNEFTCDIDNKTIEKIMLLNVDNNWKLLLMMGIGIFANQENTDYLEIMKDLAYDQRLFMIVASSDYIYGTNYQFCHGYISKDLDNSSQEKIIQAMGRIGRNQYHKKYSIRFRDNKLIDKVLMPEENKLEVINMNRLFNTPL